MCVLNEHFSKFSYICGYEPTNMDIEIVNKIKDLKDFTKFQHIKRWWYHMRSFSDLEIKSFSKSHPPDIMLIMKENLSKSLNDQVGLMYKNILMFNPL